MKNYALEAERETMSGRIVVGSRIGYSGERIFGLAELVIKMEEVNKERSSARKQNIACIVTEGVLVGRSDDTDYKEKVFQLEFAVSPRSKEMKPTVFYKFLIEYADSIGQLMEQERVYVTYRNNTQVLKSKKPRA